MNRRKRLHVIGVLTVTRPATGAESRAAEMFAHDQERESEHDDAAALQDSTDDQDS